MPATLYARGALAIDSNKGNAYGYSYNYSTQDDADDRALNECGDDCTIVMRFANQCAAYAADQAYGSTVYGWGKAATKQDAQSIAMNQCAAHGGSQCMVRVWGCDAGQ
ncbi:MAG: DUF4189 domain-containing protein [Alphaproteobacteria bacterium]|nr:DUF4189 domain-containing protein [Alphaproteobacteria bacterium]